jgi:hypothetical protein
MRQTPLAWVRGLILMGLAAAFSILANRLPAQERSGFIHGTVVGQSGAVIADARVEVASAEHKCETKSNPEGKFNCQLPPGRYRVTAVGYGFFPYRRATVNLEAPVHTFVTLRTVPGPARGTAVLESRDDIVGDRTSPVEYWEQVVNGDTDVVVRYHGAEMKEDRIAFRGPYLMLTMGTLAIYADEITCSNPIRTCTAKGSVMAEIGQERLEGATVDLDLPTRKLVLARDAVVVKAF